jgi:hypothetical protein
MVETFDILHNLARYACHTAVTRPHHFDSLGSWAASLQFRHWAAVVQHINVACERKSGIQYKLGAESEYMPGISERGHVRRGAKHIRLI